MINHVAFEKWLIYKSSTKEELSSILPIVDLSYINKKNNNIIDDFLEIKEDIKLATNESDHINIFKKTITKFSSLEKKISTLFSWKNKFINEFKINGKVELTNKNQHFLSYLSEKKTQLSGASLSKNLEIVDDTLAEFINYSKITDSNLFTVSSLFNTNKPINSIDDISFFINYNNIFLISSIQKHLIKETLDFFSFSHLNPRDFFRQLDHVKSLTNTFGTLYKKEAAFAKEWDFPIPEAHLIEHKKILKILKNIETDLSARVSDNLLSFKKEIIIKLVHHFTNQDFREYSLNKINLNKIGSVTSYSSQFNNFIDPKKRTSTPCTVLLPLILTQSVENFGLILPKIENTIQKMKEEENINAESILKQIAILKNKIDKKISQQDKGKLIMLTFFLINSQKQGGGY